MSGPAGEGLGSNTLSLLLPYLIFSYGLGALADRSDNRRLLIAVTLVRGLLLLIIPTVLTSFGATGIIIPMSIFSLSACTVLSSILDFAILPRLAINNQQLRRANATVVSITTCSTLAAVSIAPVLSEVCLPNESLRIAALFYFVAMVIFWMLDRSKTEIAVRSEGATEELSNLFKTKKGSISIFRLSFLAYAAQGIFYSLFLVFCIQNTQFNNGAASNIFATLAFGFLAGAVSLLTFLKKFKPSSLLGYSTICGAISCIFFLALGNTPWALKVFLLSIGTVCATILISINMLLQKEFNANVRGKIIGAILSLTAAIYTVAAFAIEQITIQFSAFTIIKIVAGAWLVLVSLALLSSRALQNRWRRARQKNKSKLSSKTA